MRTILCLGIAVLCSLHAAAAVAQPLVEPPSGPAYDLENGDTGTKVVIPLKLLEGATVTEVVTIAVMAGDTRQPHWIDAFPAAFDAKLSQLTITPDFQQVRLPRTYAVSIKLIGAVTKAAPAKPAAADPAGEPKPNEPKALEASTKAPPEQIVEIPLVLKPAKLAAIAPLVVARQQWHPFGQMDPTKIPLRLQETSDVTSIQALHIDQTADATNGDLPTAARIEPAGPLKLESGGRKVVELKPTDFGVGTTKGSLTISAKQLEAPVVVPFEVKIRVSDWVILPWFLVFGILGWLVRHALQSAGVLAELRVELGRLSEEIAEEADTNPSDQDVSELQKAEGTAKDALLRRDSVALREALQTLKTQLKAAQDKKADTTRKLWDQVNAIDRVLKTPFDLPVGLDLAKARGDLAAAMQALRTFRPKEADRQLVELQGSVAELAKQVGDWSVSLSDALGSLPNAQGGGVLPSTLKDEAATLVAALKEKLEKTAYDATTPPALGEWLAATHDANGALRALAGRLRQGLKLELEEVLKELKAGHPALSATLNEVLESLPRLNGDVSPDQLAALANALDDTYRALDEWLKNAEPRDLLSTGQFSEAVARELMQRTGAASASGNVSAGPPKATLGLAGMPSGASASRPAAPPSREVVMMTSPRAAHDRALVQLTTLQAARGVVSGALMAVVTWVLYRDSWIGTPGDFTGVAAFAFFTDFTLETLLDAASKVKKISIG